MKYNIYNKIYCYYSNLNKINLPKDSLFNLTVYDENFSHDFSIFLKNKNNTCIVYSRINDEKSFNVKDLNFKYSTIFYNKIVPMYDNKKFDNYQISYFENIIESIIDNTNIEYNVLQNTLLSNSVIRIYGLTTSDTDNLDFYFNNKHVPFNKLSRGYSEFIGEYYDLPASYFGVGIYKIFLKNSSDVSKYTEIFIKDKNNLMKFNVWSGTDYKKTTEGFLSGKGQFIESSTEWSFIGDRSLKITRVGDRFRWTDIPIKNIFREKFIRASVTIKSSCKLKVLFVFKDEDNNQKFSNPRIIEGDGNVRTLQLKEYVDKKVKRIALRFWITDPIGSYVYVDNIMVEDSRKNIAIFGSCCSKDPFTTTFNKNYKKRYISNITDQRHSLISLMQDKENIDEKLLEIEPKYEGSAYGVKCLKDDFYKSFIDLILSNEIDYLLLDLYFEIEMGIILYNGNNIITNSYHIKNTKFFQQMKNIKFINMRDNHEEYYKLWTEYCDKFFEFMKTFKPNTKVVLVEIRSINRFLKEDGTIYEAFVEKSKKYNPLYVELEKYIKENHEVYVIPFEKNILCVDNHHWGRLDVHYENKFYKNFLKKMDKIVEKDNN